MNERFRRDTPYIEAHASYSSFFDHRCGKPKLCGANRRDIASRARSDYDKIVLFVSHVSLLPYLHNILFIISNYNLPVPAIL